MSDLAGQIANKYGIDPGVFKRLIQQESGGRQSAKSPAGAIGETQLLPSTARSLGVNPYDTVGNLEGGAKYLRQQLDRFGGDYRKALAAYNAGPGAVEKYGGVPPFAETQAYVRNILSGGAPAASTPQSVTPQGSTTRTIPGVDNSAQRRALILQFLQRGGAQNPQAVQNLAIGLPGAQDTPGRTVNVSSPPAAGSAPNASGRLQIPQAFKPTHQTEGLPGYPALDVFGKPGTVVGSPISGKIVKVSGRSPTAGAYQGAGGPFGYSVYVSDGRRTYFLTHFGSRDVKVGQGVSRGQALGTVGDYPGRPSHIHVGLHQG